MDRAIEPTQNADIGMPPVVGADPTVLVLGSMPGEESLRARQYYAHPRNAFWPIMQELLGMLDDCTYETRLSSLEENKIALWDVIHSCNRRGSLDSSIEKSSVVLNDFNGFLSRHRTLKAIAFNGKKAEQLFVREIAPTLTTEITHIEIVSLPSTSPAYASLSRQSKLENWRTVTDFINTP